jgi:hypothetical protein
MTYTLTYWASSQVTKKMKYCEYTPRLVRHTRNKHFSLLNPLVGSEENENFVNTVLILNGAFLELEL